MYHEQEAMTPSEEVNFWLIFGYPEKGMIFCNDCNKYHESTNCLRMG